MEVSVPDRMCLRVRVWGRGGGLLLSQQWSLAANSSDCTPVPTATKAAPRAARGHKAYHT